MAPESSRFLCYNHPMPLLYIYIALTAVTFAAFGLDKFYAQTHRWRIPERVLLGLALVGGAYGALAGMLIFRHKTRKAYFWWWVIAACVVHAALFVWVWVINQ